MASSWAGEAHSHHTPGPRECRGWGLRLLGLLQGPVGGQPRKPNRPPAGLHAEPESSVHGRPRGRGCSGLARHRSALTQRCWTHLFAPRCRGLEICPSENVQPENHPGVSPAKGPSWPRAALRPLQPELPMLLAGPGDTPNGPSTVSSYRFFAALFLVEERARGRGTDRGQAARPSRAESHSSVWADRPGVVGPAAGTVHQDSTAVEADQRDTDGHVCTSRPSGSTACDLSCDPWEAADCCPWARSRGAPPPGGCTRSPMWAVPCTVRSDPGWEALVPEPVNHSPVSPASPDSRPPCR